MLSPAEACGYANRDYSRDSRSKTEWMCVLRRPVSHDWVVENMYSYWAYTIVGTASVSYRTPIRETVWYLSRFQMTPSARGNLTSARGS